MLAQVVLFDGFDPLDALAPYEVLSGGGFVADGRPAVELVSAEGARPVTSGLGMTVYATAALDPERADLVIVPGAAGIPEGDGPGTVQALLAQAAATALAGLLRTAMARTGCTVATVCGGSLVLGMAGLLAGRNATTNRRGLDALAAMGAVPVPARVVDDGDLVTAGGVTSGLDLGLYLLERELGPRIAHAVETLMEHERRGTVWHADGLAPAAF